MLTGWRSVIVCGLSAIWCASGLASERSPLKIEIVEGDGAINDGRRGIGHGPAVEVRDEANQPVSGARVLFTLPYSGASGSFAGGSRTFETVTDGQGRAAAPTFKPNKTEGRLNVSVAAFGAGREGHAVIAQRNTMAVSQASGGGGRKKLVWLALIGGGAAGGVLAAGLGGKSSSSSGVAAASPTTLSVGSITIGGPK